MTNRRIFIGDVHGHYDPLVTLLNEIAPGKDDNVYFLGDLIDRGPKSAEVVELVIKNKYHCLRGNHEDMLLDVVGNGQEMSMEGFQAWLYSGGYATITSYGNSIPQSHVDWMRSLPYYLDLDDIWLVHAGVNPNMPLEAQTSDQFCWIRDDFHSSEQPYFKDKLIVTGHTITFTIPGVEPGYLASGAGWLDIETGAYHPNSGWLTAVDMTNELVYQVNTHEGTLRTIPLAEATVKIDPAKVALKRAQRKMRPTRANK
ncbi:MAG: metallophosphoesterase family protein [Prochloraceae cyanobacterium]